MVVLRGECMKGDGSGVEFVNCVVVDALSEPSWIPMTALRVAIGYNRFMAGEEDFEHRIIHVTGKVSTIKSEGVELEGETELSGRKVTLKVSCRFHDSSKQQLLNLGKGQDLTLRGRCAWRHQPYVDYERADGHVTA